MKRYVDVDELGIGRANPDAFENKDYVDGWNSAISILEKADVEDVVKVVRCKDCKYFQYRYVELSDGSKRPYKKGESIVPLSVGINVGSYCTRIDYAIVHGYRNGEPSVDETRLWTKPDDFCSYGERKDEK